MVLEVSKLTQKFGRFTAVKRISFKVKPGSICGFIGPNGAGKTTTLRMLATVDAPTAGNAWIDGHSITEAAEKVRPILGFMPDYLGTYQNMLVHEYLDFFARAHGLKGSQRTKQIEAIIDFTEISSMLKKKVDSLSKGMSQRISLARILLHDPKLLLLDEPAAGLDPQARADFRELLHVLADNGKTIFISSHILSELEDMVNQVVIIRDGKVAFSGAPEQVHSDKEAEFELTIRTLASASEAQRYLLETPYIKHAAIKDEDTLTLTLSGGKEAIAETVKMLVERNVLPYEVRTEGRTLERMFQQATAGGKKNDIAG
jgi:ABC-2 type transport system ATP-binding protein